MIATVGGERSDAGPPKTMLQLTSLGRRQLDTWLQTPVAHMRDVRSELLLKLALLARLERSAQPLASAQAEAFEPLLAGLEQLAAAATAAEFEATLLGWRLDSARAAMRFLHGLAVHPTPRSELELTPIRV